MVSQHTVIHLSVFLWYDCTATYWMNEPVQGIGAFLTGLCLFGIFCFFAQHHIGTHFWV